MPLYEYKCRQCHHRLEKIQSFNSPPEKVCPKCGGELERVISAPAIQFKGAGWYVNDYARSGAKSTPADGADGKTESKAASGSEKESANEVKSSSDSASAATGSSSSSSSGSESAAGTTASTTKTGASNP